MKYLAYHYANYGERQERMGVNQELNALQKEVTRQKILEAGFRIFAEKTIEPVSMQEIADAAGLGVATVYRYYGSKPALVLGVGAWIWEQYVARAIQAAADRNMTAAEELEFFLDSFLDLYRNHRDMLRFNQFFNVYVEREGLPADTLSPYSVMLEGMAARFHVLYGNAQRDGTLRTDVSEGEMFSATLHLMMAAVTRYAVGLIYDGGPDPEGELVLLKKMLLREFAAGES